MSVVGYATWPNGRVALTDEDALWLGRSLAGETSATETGRAAASWAMLQRMVWMRDHGHTTTEGMPCSRAPTGRGIPELEPVRRQLDFTGMLRCFSSPVNPYHTDRDATRSARRRFFISASWAALEGRSPGIKDFVYRFLRGRVANPVPRAADFDAPGEVPAGATRLYTIGGNVFMPESGTMSWPDDYVTIKAKRGFGFSTSTPLNVAVGLGAAGAVGWLLLKIFGR